MMILIIDSVMGSGKTTWAIHYMNTHSHERFLYITPYIDEAARIAEACPALKFLQPQEEPYSKSASFHEMFGAGRNIALTHELFSRIKITKTERQLIRECGYTLILDEALQVVSQLKVTASDIRKLLATETIAYDENTRLVTWKDTEYSGLFGPLKRQVQSGSVRFMDETMILWVFPKETLEAFPAVFVLTYLFSGSLMKSYLNLCGLTYQINHVRNGILFHGLNNDRSEKSCFRILLQIEEKPKLNDIGEAESALSFNWYKKRSKIERVIPLRHAYNFLHNICGAACDQSMYTVYKDVKERCRILRYKEKSFVSCNCRATNKYGERWAMAYLINVYINPYVRRWFERQGVELDEEAYALSQMVQWIWRGAIRNGKSVHLYLPSARMRRILLRWLNDGAEKGSQTESLCEMKSKVRVPRTLRYNLYKEN